MARILVTGGAGYIGAHTVRALAADHDVVVVDDLSAGRRDFVPERVALDVVRVERAAEFLPRHRPDAVVHFAGAIEAGLSMTEPARFYRANVAASLALLEAVLAGADPPIPVVYSSSAAVYGTPARSPIVETDPLHPESVYGETKLVVERALASYRDPYGLRSTSLRYFNAAGAAADGSLGEAHPIETHLIPLAIRAMLAGEPVRVFGTDYPTPDGTCIRDYVHVADLANAHVLALDALLGGEPGGVYNVGVGTGFSVQQVLDAVESVAGRPLERQLTSRRPGDPAELVADPTRIARELGWRPAVTELAEIIRTAWGWHARQAKAGRAQT